MLQNENIIYISLIFSQFFSNLLYTIFMIQYIWGKNLFKKCKCLMCSDFKSDLVFIETQNSNLIFDNSG